MRLGDLGLLALMVFGLLPGNAVAGPEGTDMRLEDMGFVMRVADTPQQLDRLRLLPARKFVSRTKGARRYYLYADPDYCKCVFLGDALAMKNYQNSGIAGAASTDGHRIGCSSPDGRATND